MPVTNNDFARLTHPSEVCETSERSGLSKKQANPERKCFGRGLNIINIFPKNTT